MNTRLFILITLLFSTLQCRLPTNFDLRVQPSIIKYADYSLKQQGTCVAHSWGLQFAQILSNAASLQMKNKIRLSSQHLIECISSKNQICHDASIQNINAAIDYIQKHGITTNDCIKNRPFQQPRQFCPRQCDNGYKFDYQIKGIFSSHQNFSQLLNKLTEDEKTSAFLIVKVYDSMNYYSSQKPDHLNAITNENFGYRVGQVVGWKNKGSRDLIVRDLIVRLGSGQGWGYNGFAYINEIRHKDMIVARYSVKTGDTQGKRIIKSIQDEQLLKQI